MADNKRTGLSALADAGNEGEDFSVIDAIGGPRGVIESMRSEEHTSELQSQR